MVKIGDRVQYIKSIEWGPSAGDAGVVTHIFSDGSFLVRCDGSVAAYCTHRREVCITERGGRV